jgi:hypothetical protein
MERETGILMDRVRISSGGQASSDPAVAIGEIEEEALLDGSPNGRSLLCFATSCAVFTLDELTEQGWVPDSRENILTEYSKLLRARREEEPFPEFLVFLAQRNLGAECIQEISSEADRLVSLMLRSQRLRKIVRCPFLHLTRTPAIYREIPSVQLFCRLMMLPVVQAHEKELITLCSVNPVTAVKAMKIVSQLVEDATGRRPIPAVTVAPAAHWRELNRKHFGL